jgi:hypothetical protein
VKFLTLVVISATVQKYVSLGIEHFFVFSTIANLLGAEIRQASKFFAFICKTD